MDGLVEKEGTVASMRSIHSRAPIGTGTKTEIEKGPGYLVATLQHG